MIGLFAARRRVAERKAAGPRVPGAGELKPARGRSEDWARCNAAFAGRTVDVYRNLHNGLWSVRYNGRVVGHTSLLTLTGAAFVVNTSGRERARRERRHNVHAFVRGTLAADPGAIAATSTGCQVTYSPFSGVPSFERCSDGAAVDGAAVVRFLPGRDVFALGLWNAETEPLPTLPAPDSPRDIALRVVALTSCLSIGVFHLFINHAAFAVI